MRPRSKWIKEPGDVVAWFLDLADRKDNGCLICHLKTYYRNNYPKTTVKGKMWPVHRLVFSVVNGPIPEGLCVLHSCDNPRCIEIGHLRLGTHEENMKDMAKRNRSHNQWTNWSLGA